MDKATAINLFAPILLIIVYCPTGPCQDQKVVEQKSLETKQFLIVLKFVIAVGSAQLAIAKGHNGIRERHIET